MGSSFVGCGKGLIDTFNPVPNIEKASKGDPVEGTIAGLKLISLCSAGSAAKTAAEPLTRIVNSTKAKGNSVLKTLSSETGSINPSGFTKSSGLSNKTSKADTFKSIKTPYGDAVQSTSKKALQVKQYVDNGGQIYRGGTFGRSNVTDAQFWASESPLTFGYADKYGVDFTQMDYIIGARPVSGAKYITRPAPGLGNNIGGAIEVVTDPNSIKLDFFYMP